jgi:predicted DCC family thiol-disulfide oxidoreductase YuxK
MYALYDGNCRGCRRAIGMLRMFDVFGRIEYVNALSAGDGGRYMGIARSELLVDMHVIRGRRVWRGFEAYRAMAARIPILWVIWPLLWIWPIAALGRWRYRHVADSRSCEVPGARRREPRAARPLGAELLRPVVVVGMIMILANAAYGVKRQRTGWPFSCYPPFALIEPPMSTEMDLAALAADGTLIAWDEKGLIKRFTYPRWATLMRRLSDEGSEARYRAFWRVVVAHDSAVERAVRVEFYRDRYSTDPERRPDTLLRREVVYAMELDGEERAGDGDVELNGAQGLSRPKALGG